MEVIWISTLKGQIGIVLSETDEGKPHAYIGIADANIESIDIQMVKELGGKLSREDVLKLEKYTRPNLFYNSPMEAEGIVEVMATHEHRFYVNANWTRLVCECGKSILPGEPFDKYKP